MSGIKERVDELLHKPMNRQQFLKHAGLVLLAVVGVTGIINSLDGKQSPKAAQTASGDGMAYGAAVYAGGKKPV